MDRMGVLSCSAHRLEQRNRNATEQSKTRSYGSTEKFAANANGWNFKVNWIRMERRVELVDVR